MKEDKKDPKKAIARDTLVLLLVLLIASVLVLIFPQNRDNVIDTSLNFLIEMMLILPAVMVILGIFAVFVPKEFIRKHLGKGSGIKGILIGMVLGALPTGPLYIAFPMASAMIKKGARTSSIIAFLSAWACIKIPQEMVELKFLGLEFMILRLGLTIFFVMIMSVLIERIMEWSDGRKQMIVKEDPTWKY